MFCIFPGAIRLGEPFAARHSVEGQKSSKLLSSRAAETGSRQHLLQAELILETLENGIQ